MPGFRVRIRPGGYPFALADSHEGMAKDLHLVGYRFNWALTVFYFTYVLFVLLPTASLSPH